jgi:TetR/AcrR family transcriptional repressor of nem operon
LPFLDDREYGHWHCDAALVEIASDQAQTSMAMLDFYVQPYLQFANTPDRVCLSGALAGEMLALPPEMRQRVGHFFRTHQAWLTKILKRGAASGEFALPAPATKVARLMFAALQGSLLVKRTIGDLSQINDVIAVMKLQLAAR